MAMPMHPNTLQDYLDLAKTRSEIPNDKQLAERLGITRTSLSQMRSGQLWPGDDLMLKLAKLAREDGPFALLMLNGWKAKDAYPKAAWDELIAFFRKSAATIIFALFLAGHAYPPQAQARVYAPATSGHLSGPTVYYGKWRRLLSRFRKR